MEERFVFVICEQLFSSDVESLTTAKIRKTGPVKKIFLNRFSWKLPDDPPKFIYNLVGRT